MFWSKIFRILIHWIFKYANRRTSMILLKIMRKRICNASAFFFSKPCPLWAPARRAFINIWALSKKIYWFGNYLHFTSFHNSIESNFVHKLTLLKGKWESCPFLTFSCDFLCKTVDLENFLKSQDFCFRRSCERNWSWFEVAKFSSGGKIWKWKPLRNVMRGEFCYCNLSFAKYLFVSLQRVADKDKLG